MLACKVGETIREIVEWWWYILGLEQIIESRGCKFKE
jgi:hypothetical protein